MIASVRISSEVSRLILESARKDSAREVCGLMGGRGGVITYVFPAANAAGNPATSYEIAPQEIFQRMREMRAAGLELLGIYHSHPNGENEPSRRDIESAYYPDAAYFIISPVANAPRPVRAFSIRDGRTVELEIHVVPVEERHDQSA